MPDLPPVSEDFTADGSQYIAELEAMREAAAAAAEANDRLLVSARMAASAARDAAAAAAGDAAAQSAAADAIKAAAEAAVADAAAQAELAAAERDAAAAAAENAAAQASEAAAQGEVRGNAAGAAAALATETAMLALEADAAKSAAESAAILAAGEQAAADVAKKQAVSMAAATAGMGLLAKAQLGLAGTAAPAAAAGRLLGLTWNQWHWVLGVTAEALAVIIPAMVALGSASVVASQGAQMVYEHMTALWTASEATATYLHVSAGQALGFSDALQRAQNEANPQVYQALAGVLGMLGGRFSAFAAGSDKALTTVKSGFGGLAAAGNQVLGVFDTFIAKVQYDMVAGFGSTVHGLLSGMVTDLAELAAFFGNLGHAVLNVAADMPGLAHVLLAVITGLSKLLELVTAPAWYNFGGQLITWTVGAEEFYRWGGLLVNTLTRLGLASALSTQGLTRGEAVIVRFASILAMIGGIVPRLAGALVSFAGAAVTGMGRLLTGAEEAGGAISGLGAKITALAGDTALMTWAGAAIAVLGVLAYMISRVTTQAQQWITAQDKAVTAASNLTVLNTLAAAIQGTTEKIAANQQILGRYPPLMQAWARQGYGLATSMRGIVSGLGPLGSGLVNVTAGLANFAGGILKAIPSTHNMGVALTGMAHGARAALAFQQLTAAQQHWVRQSVNVVRGATEISRTFGTTFTGSLALAGQAGVKLTQSIRGQSEAAIVARVKIADLVAAYSAMGQGTTTISGDMEYLAVASGMAASKVQQLTQAEQQYAQLASGGEAATAQLAQSIRNIGQVAGVTANNLGTATGQMNLSVSQFARQLSLGAVRASSAWTNFTQVTSSTLPQLISWFQQAGTAGAVQWPKMRQGILDAAAATVKYAKDSPAAQAAVLADVKMLGPAAKNWAALTTAIRSNHASMRGLGPLVDGITTRFGDLLGVAQHLGNVLSSDVTATMDRAKVAASGLYQASLDLASALDRPHPPATVLHGDIQRLVDVGMSLYHNRSQADAYAQAYLSGFGKVGVAAWKAFHDVTAATSKIPPQMRQMGEQAGRDGTTAMASAITGGRGKVTSAASSVVTASHGVVSRLDPQWQQAGASATQGLANGILSREAAAVSAAQQVAAAATSAMARSLQVRSPSTLTRQYGVWTVQGLINGLTAGEPQLQQTVRMIIGRLAAALRSGTITAGQHSALVDWVRDDNTRLQALAAQRQRIAAQIKAADAAAGAARSSLASIIGLGHAPAPYTGKVPTAQQMVANLRTELGDMRRFAADLKKLKALGLDDSIISRIVAMGPMQGTAYAEALISAASAAAGGAAPGAAKSKPATSGVISQLNSAYTQVEAYSKTGAVSVANAMYDAGRKAADGLAAGLRSEEKTVDREMRRIADTLVGRLRHDLKISSPSAVMAGEGLAVDEGLAKGLMAGRPMVEAAARAVAAAATVSPLTPGGPSAGPRARGVPLAAAGVPAVNPGGPAVVNVHVYGHVVTEHQLGDLIRDVTAGYSWRNPTTGLVPPLGRR